MLSDLIAAAYAIVNNLLIPIAFALCLLYFFWGVSQYIRNGAGSEKAAEDGKRVMVWGVVALFVVFSIWGIINFIKGEFNLPDTTTVKLMGH